MNFAKQVMLDVTKKVVQMAWRAEPGNEPLFKEVGNPKIIGEIGANGVKIVIGIDIIAKIFTRNIKLGLGNVDHVTRWELKILILLATKMATLV